MNPVAQIKKLRVIKSEDTLPTLPSEQVAGMEGSALHTWSPSMEQGSLPSPRSGPSLTLQDCSGPSQVSPVSVASQ